jgi:hypothetical protein
MTVLPSKTPSSQLILPLITLCLGFMAGFSSTNKSVCPSFQTQENTFNHDNNKAIPTASSSSSHQPPSVEGNHHNNCIATLDALDETFNQRRRTRVIRAEQFSGPPDPKMFFDLFEPEAVCFTDERFGGPHRYDAFGDGPKFVCGIDYLRATTTTTTTRKPKKKKKKKQKASSSSSSSSSCLVYSVGSHNDIEFEMGIDDLLPGCETHTFDPTLRVPFLGDAYSTFHPWGLGQDGVTVTYNDNTFVTQSFMNMFRALGHVGRRLDILKVDCEGCEYDAMVPLFEAMVRNEIQVDQLLIEIHTPFRAEPEKQWKLLLELFVAADRAKMRIFHKERNPSCNGYNCVEYAFASEDFLRRANADLLCG